MDEDNIKLIEMFRHIIDPSNLYYQINDQIADLTLQPLFGEIWQPTENQIIFQKDLKVGDEVDALKIDYEHG